ncbi:ECF transporter S component [Inconstantimicrobium mannanitabidum]|uniref:Riboflavin transporter n=1 Tax=Inconstantimicrobium mannanitabidum TaxID=1604901 RepID=A0ACB5R7I6_9CLOT|nr:ECF transporter S component [Clostridium sp. TW13]GKX64969.1 riboflavin transporter [Clostridium sp. TW13]
MKKNNTNTMVKIGVFTAVAVVLMYFSFPLPIFPAFLRFDFSDMPALIGSFALGPVAGVLIELLKNVINVVIKGSYSMLIGEFANFAVGAVWVFTAGYIYKKNKTKKMAVMSLLVSVVVMSVFGSLLNYFVLLPMYTKAFHMEFGNLAVYASTVMLPFNLLKGAITSIVTFPLYKAVSVALKLEAPAKKIMG